MEQDQRLTPLPRVADLQTNNADYPASYAGFYDDESFANKRSLRQYFNVVYKRLPIILAITLIVTAAVSFYSYRLPSVYQASTEMIIEPRKPQVTQKDAININFGGEQNYTNTQLKLLQNPDLMKKAVVALNLHHEPNLFGNDNRGIFAGISSLFSGGAKSATPENTLPVVNEAPSSGQETQKIELTPEEDARATKYGAILGGGIRVDQVENTNLVNVSVQSSNPALAAKFVDKVADIFIDDNAKRELEGSQKAYEELTTSIEDLKVTIGEQENKLTEYMRSSNLPLQDKGQELSADRLQTISGQWLAAADDRRKLEARYNAAQAANSRGE